MCQKARLQFHGAKLVLKCLAVVMFQVEGIVACYQAISIFNLKWCLSGYENEIRQILVTGTP